MTEQAKVMEPQQWNLHDTTTPRVARAGPLSMNTKRDWGRALDVPSFYTKLFNPGDNKVQLHSKLSDKQVIISVLHLMTSLQDLWW